MLQLPWRHNNDISGGGHFKNSARLPIDCIASLTLPLYVSLKPLYLAPSGSIQLADIILLTASVVLFAEIRNSGIWKSHRIRNTVGLYAGLCVFQGLVNTIWSLRLGVSIVKPTLYYLFNLLAFLIALATTEMVGMETMGRNLAYGCLVSLCIICVGEALRGGELYSTSFFNNPNQLGFHCLILISIAIYVRKYMHPVLCVCIIVASSIELLLSASRAAFFAWVVLIVSLAMCLVWDRGCPLAIPLAMVACAISALYMVLIPNSPIVASFSQLQNLREQILSASIDYNSLFGNGRGYNRVFEMKGNMIWGMGEGAYWRFETLPGLELHSTYASLLVSYGLVGFVGYTILFMQCVCDRGQTIQNLMALSGILLYQVVHNGVRNTIVWMLLAAILITGAISPLTPRFMKQSGALDRTV